MEIATWEEKLVNIPISNKTLFSFTDAAALLANANVGNCSVVLFLDSIVETEPEPFPL